jgi:hypothetical protein
MSILQNPEIEAHIQTLRKLSFTIDLRDLTLGDKKSLSQSIYVTERRLLTLESTHLDFYTTSSSLHYAMTVSALLYLQMMIREIPSMCKVHERLVTKLDDFLAHRKQTHSNSHHPEDIDIILWVRFVQAAASPTRERCLALVEQKVSREILRERLRKVLWRNKLCDQTYERIWRERPQCT